jgi:chromatin remodeling complex protein RSC6
MSSNKLAKKVVPKVNKKTTSEPIKEEVVDHTPVEESSESDSKVPKTKKKGGKQDATKNVKDAATDVATDAAKENAVKEEETQGTHPETHKEASAHAPVSVEKMIDDILERKKAENKTLKEDLKMLRDLKATWNRQLRQLKTTKKRREVSRDGTKRKPSGFAQPTPIKEPLCDFLGQEHGSLAARTDVTREVIQYIGKEKLEQVGNRRYIVLNEPLTKLFGSPEERLQTMKERKEFLRLEVENFPNKETKKFEKLKRKYEKCEVTDRVSYFNVQTHLNKHFYKKNKVPESTKIESAPMVATAMA